MAKNLEIFSGARGIETEPTTRSDWQSPADLVNLEINKQTTQYQRRKGFVADNTPILRAGNMIGVANVLSKNDRAGYKKIFRHGYDETWVIEGERLIIADGNTPQWIDLLTDREYDLKSDAPDEPPAYIVPAPQTPPSNYNDTPIAENLVTTPLDLPGSASHRTIRRFAIFYTFFNSRLGLRTPPSPAMIFSVMIDSRGYDRNIRRHRLSPAIPLDIAPAWSQGVELWGTVHPIRSGKDYNTDRFADNILTLNDNVLARYVPAEYITDDLELECILLERTGAVGTGLSNINMNLDLTFPNNEEPTVSNVSDQVTVTIDASKYYEYFTTLPSGDAPKLQHILKYAGRLWGYDQDSNSIVFSYIDGDGVSRLDVFPDDPIPHSFSLVGLENSSVTGMAAMPNESGIAVFFRDAIRFIRGQSLLTGLFSSEVSPHTDLDASQGIPNVGTMSPHSIVNYMNSLVFLGSDRVLYSMNSSSLNDIGKEVQKYFEDLAVSDLNQVTSTVYQDKLYLVAGTDVLVYDGQYSYWTTHSVNATDFEWSRGGDSNESIMYGASAEYGFIRVDEGTTDTGFSIPWVYESQQFNFDDIVTFNKIIINTNNESAIPVHVQIIVNDKIVLDDSYVPSYNNKFLKGFYARGNKLKVILRSNSEVPEIGRIEIGYA